MLRASGSQCAHNTELDGQPPMFILAEAWKKNSWLIVHYLAVFQLGSRSEAKDLKQAAFNYSIQSSFF